MTVKFDGRPAGPPPKDGNGFVAAIAIAPDGTEYGPWSFVVTPEARARGVTIEGLVRKIEQYMSTGE